VFEVEYVGYGKVGLGISMGFVEYAGKGRVE